MSDEVQEIKINQIKMMRSRGYEIPEHEVAMLDADLSYFMELARSNGRSVRDGLSTVYFHPATSKKTYVYYHYGEGNKDVGRNVLVQIGVFIDADADIDSAILITERKVSPAANQKMRELTGYHFQNFRFDELDYDPMAHVYSSKYEIVSQEHLRTISPDNPIDPSKLPLCIVKDLHYTAYRNIKGDPVAKYLGAQNGDLIRVTRRNFFTDTPVKTSFIYRRVKAI